MESDKIIKAQKIFQEAEDKYQILMDTGRFLSVKERFDLSHTISDHITSNNNLLEYCKENEEYSSKRKTLLEAIQAFQKNLIESTTTPSFEINIDESYNVKDYQTASSSLNEIAEDELENGFISEEYDEILSTIPECRVHVSTLKDVVARLKGEIYNVLIMGEYQSGKTTLIDAIIGQYVGAIGDGRATSAVPISYSYAAEEKIKVVWRSKERLIQMLSILGMYIKDANLDSFNIENANERQKLLDKLNLFRKGDDCPKSSEAGCKSLAICSLILRYYGTEEWETATSTVYSDKDIPWLTRFPKNDEADFQTYWRKRGESKFGLQNALFAFIERIDCYIDSCRLKELNCTIIDAPGLFSNDYDTQVTQKEMERADAILYLLPYDKQAGEKTCGSLFTIKRKYPDIARKLFVVNNRNSSDRRKNFVNANKSSIEELFDGKTEIRVVDAHLAWLGVVKDAYENGNLSNSFMSDFLWMNLGDSFNGKISDIDFEEVIAEETLPYRIPKDISGQEIIAKSGLITVLDELIDFIKYNKAYSIIVSNGIAKMCSEVLSIRNSLYLQKIEPFVVGHEQLVELWETRLRIAEDFSKMVKNISEAHFFNGVPSLCTRLSGIVGSRIFDDDAVKNLCQKVATAIYNQKWKLIKMGKNKAKIEKHLKPIISEVIVDFVTSKITYWNDLMKSGQDVTFSCVFNPEMTILKSKLEKEWQTLYIADPEFATPKIMSKYFEVPTSTRDFAMREQKDGGDQNISVKQGALAPYIIGDLMTTITGIVGIILMLAMPTILAIVSNPVGWAVGLVIGAGSIIYATYKGEDALERKFVQKVAPDILSKLRENNIQGTLEGIIHKEMNEILHSYIGTLKVNKKLMENDGTIAISTPTEEIANNCSVALELTEEIDSQLATYKDFILSNLAK